MKKNCLSVTWVVVVLVSIGIIITNSAEKGDILTED